MAAPYVPYGSDAPMSDIEERKKRNRDLETAGFSPGIDAATDINFKDARSSADLNRGYRGQQQNAVNLQRQAALGNAPSEAGVAAGRAQGTTLANTLAGTGNVGGATPRGAPAGGLAAASANRALLAGAGAGSEIAAAGAGGRSNEMFRAQSLYGRGAGELGRGDVRQAGLETGMAQADVANRAREQGFRDTQSLYGIHKGISEQGIEDTRYINAQKGALGQAGLAARRSDADRANTQAYTGAGASAVGSGGGTLIDSYKKNHPSSEWDDSDERGKRATSDPDPTGEHYMQHVQEPSAEAWRDFFEDAKGGVYTYKDPNSPGADHGVQVGPRSAQEMTKDPIGQTIVKQGPNGLVLDVGQLSKVNTAAVSHLGRRIDAIEAAMAPVPHASPAGPPDSTDPGALRNRDMGHALRAMGGDVSSDPDAKKAAYLQGRRDVVRTLEGRDEKTGEVAPPSPVHADDPLSSPQPLAAVKKWLADKVARPATAAPAVSSPAEAKKPADLRKFAPGHGAIEFDAETRRLDEERAARRAQDEADYAALKAEHQKVLSRDTLGHMKEDVRQFFGVGKKQESREVETPDTGPGLGERVFWAAAKSPPVEMIREFRRTHDSGPREAAAAEKKPEMIVLPPQYVEDEPRKTSDENTSRPLPPPMPPSRARVNSPPSEKIPAFLGDLFGRGAGKLRGALEGFRGAPEGEVSVPIVRRGGAELPSLPVFRRAEAKVSSESAPTGRFESTDPLDDKNLRRAMEQQQKAPMSTPGSQGSQGSTDPLDPANMRKDLESHRSAPASSSRSTDTLSPSNLPKPPSDERAKETSWLPFRPRRTPTSDQRNFEDIKRAIDRLTSGRGGATGSY